MALSLPLGPRFGSEPLNHPPGAPREPDIVGCTVCPTSGEERMRWGPGLWKLVPKRVGVVAGAI